MKNPFEIIDVRLSNIENLILELKNQPTAAINIQESDILFDIQQAADFLKLSVATVYSKVSKRELPYIKRGKKLYFSQIELLEYIKEGKRKSFEEINTAADSYFNNKK